MDARTIQHPKFVAHIMQVAAANNIPYQIRQPGGGGTNAGAIQPAGKVHALVMDLNNFRDTQTPAHRRPRTALKKRIPFIRARISEEETPGYITAMIELFEACKGDDFESDSHAANPSKYFTICSRVSTIKSELIKVKL